MHEERKRILKLVENGVISAEEAIVLLEKLGTTTEQKAPMADSTKEKETFQGEFTKEESKKEEEDPFLDDLKKDFNYFSTKVMDFVGDALNKVTGTNFSTMGKEGAVEWTIPLEGTFNSISVDMPNGQLTVRDSADERAYLEVTSTPILQIGSMKDLTEEEIREQFNYAVDGETLRIHHAAKMIKSEVIAYIPKDEYKKIRANLFNGSFTMHNVDVEQVRVETKNGSIKLADIKFDSIEVESVNGSIDIRDLTGRELEAETVNGRVYVDGKIQSLEGQSVNGHVVLTTRDHTAKLLKGQTVAGSIEVYIPKDLSLDGEVSSAFGKMDVKLSDVEFLQESNQMFSKTTRFRKSLDHSSALSIKGETKTGSVIVRYTL